MSSNWSQTVSFQDQIALAPTSLDDLLRIVSQEAKVRVRGTAHSFNEIANTDATSISLHAMPAMVEVDSNRQVARVAAGMKYGDVATALQAKGWALQNMASLPHISIAGSIATGTHGSGVRNGNLATAVHSLTIALADGQMQRIEHGTSEFNALAVGLGLGGIAVEYELAVVPTFNIAQQVFPGIARADLRQTFLDTMGIAYSVSFFTDWAASGTGNLWVKASDSDEMPNQILGCPPSDVDLHPIPGLAGTACTTQRNISGSWNDRLPHFKMEFTPSNGDEIQSEFFVGIADAQQALEAVESIAESISPHLWICELRTVKSDSLWLSGSYHRDTLAIHFTWKKSEKVRDLAKLVEERLLPFEYRPHWGKVFTTNADYLKTVYPKWEDFRTVITHLDPTAKFANAMTQQFFYC